MSGDHEEVPATLFSNDTWMSLTGLLNPVEFFFTVDHNRVWRHHLAWSKADGAQLKQLTVQQFSTNMIFMSLLLSSELGVLFNSSEPANDMREHMTNGEYGTLEFWTGVVVIWSVAITGVALMATFTAWRMVSAVADENTHCILRSSIGLFVTQFPSRLVVMALYSFSLWFSMFVILLLPFPFGLVLLIGLMVIFFQMIMVYSAFGRIIIHTGAMGTKRVLDPELEQSLLSSGLHTSLLIKAMARSRRKETADTQYQKPPQMRNSSSGSTSRFIDRRQSQEEDGSERACASDKAVKNDRPSANERLSKEKLMTPTSFDDPDGKGAATNGTPARNPVPAAPSSKPPINLVTESSPPKLGARQITPDRELRSSGGSTGSDSDKEESPSAQARNVLKRTGDWKDFSSFPRGKPTRLRERWRRPNKASSMPASRLQREWDNESNVRSTYDAPPPAELPEEEEEEDYREGSDEGYDDAEEFEEEPNHLYDESVKLPRPSFLNKRFSLNSLLNLAKVAQEDDDHDPQAAPNAFRLDRSHTSAKWYGAIADGKGNRDQYSGGNKKWLKSFRSHNVASTTIAEESDDSETGRIDLIADNLTSRTESWKSAQEDYSWNDR